MTEKTFGKSGSVYDSMFAKVLRRNPIGDGAISDFKGQKSVPE